VQKHFIAQRKFEQAAAACQRVIQVKPDARAYKIWGNARQAQGKVEEAKNCYAKAIELDPDFAEAYTNLGTLYAQEQQWQSAIAFYQKAIGPATEFSINLPKFSSRVDANGAAIGG
jgi:tetratricopeptide (TPR) repeat protein